jgi:hypothetical protein
LVARVRAPRSFLVDEFVLADPAAPALHTRAISGAQQKGTKLVTNGFAVHVTGLVLRKLQDHNDQNNDHQDANDDADKTSVVAHSFSSEQQ